MTSNASAIARIVPVDRLFTLLARSILVPAGWMAMATRTGRDPLLVHPGERCESQDVVDVLFVRTCPIECTAEQSQLRSADGYECRGSIRLPVRVLAELAELAAFRNIVLGSRDSAAISDVQRYLYWQMGQVLADLAARYFAAELIQPLTAATVRVVVEDRLGAACLAGGLAIDGPAAVQFNSPAYQEHRRHRTSVERQQERLAARTQIQQALAAAQRDHLTHLVNMLERMSQATESRDDLSMMDLLRTFSEEQRGQMYAALWHLCPPARATRFVAVVSGQELLLFEPDRLQRPARRIALPDTLGALRSASVDARSLEAGLMMVGAARGVHLVEIDTGAIGPTLSANVEEGHDLRGGVNAAAMSDDRVFASHSELGLMAWLRDQAGGQPACCLHRDLTSGARTLRCVRIADLSLWFAVDEVLFSLALAGDSAEPVRYGASTATLSAVTVAGPAVYAGNVDGQIIAWEAGEPDSARIVRGATGNPVESIDVVEVGGVARLVVADRSRALLAMVIGDNYCCRYESPSHIVRRAASAEDVFVAMNDLRDQLIAWNPRDPSQPTAAIIIPHLTGDRVQDLCLIP